MIFMRTVVVRTCVCMEDGFQSAFVCECWKFFFSFVKFYFRQPALLSIVVILSSFARADKRMSERTGKLLLCKIKR